MNTSYSYDAADRQTTITDYVSGGSALATYVYSYDNSNRVTTMVDAEGTYTYTYDNANELTSVDKGGTQVESYAYDANGNRTGTGYSTTVMNETMTSPGVITYTYDNAGNMISADSGGTYTTYTYDYRNRLTGVKQGGTVIATYTYNALDQRIGIQDSGGSTTWTIYNGTSADALPYGDFNGSGGTLLTRYVSGPGMVNGAVVDELLARTSSGGTTAWYLTDKLDSVRDVVSSAGAVLDHVVYDSFGNITTETNASNGDRFKFAGMEYDATTLQYYDHARTLAPSIGRFDSTDPTAFHAADANLYRYTSCDPVNAVDPTGGATVSQMVGLPSAATAALTAAQIPLGGSQGNSSSTPGIPVWRYVSPFTQLPTQPPQRDPFSEITLQMKYDKDYKNSLLAILDRDDFRRNFRTTTASKNTSRPFILTRVWRAIVDYVKDKAPGILNDQMQNDPGMTVHDPRITLESPDIDVGGGGVSITGKVYLGDRYEPTGGGIFFTIPTFVPRVPSLATPIPTPNGGE